MPDSCLESTKPRTSVSERCKARNTTAYEDKENQAPQLWCDSLAFGEKSFPDLHLGICQVSSAVGDLVSSSKVALKPTGSKLWCLRCSCCCIDVEPEPTVYLGSHSALVLETHCYVFSSMPPDERSLSMVMERTNPRKPGISIGLLFVPSPILPTAPDKRKREEGGRKKSEGHISDSDETLFSWPS